MLKCECKKRNGQEVISLPEKLNPTGEVLMAAEQKRAYDEVCKKVLALKEIAARILAAVV